MSIKSLFEDIADAIREKSGSSETYTPAEMPSAIRSIPSGSSTASGVSYDNTASGLTANNVQDAIDELAEDVSSINSDLSELRTVNEFSATSTSPYSVIDNQSYCAERNGAISLSLQINTYQASAVSNVAVASIPSQYAPAKTSYGIASYSDGSGIPVNSSVAYVDNLGNVYLGTIPANVYFYSVAIQYVV